MCLWAAVVSTLLIVKFGHHLVWSIDSKGFACSMHIICLLKCSWVISLLIWSFLLPLYTHINLNRFSSSMVCNCDPVFTIYLWCDLFKMAGVKLHEHGQSKVATRPLECTWAASLLTGLVLGWMGSHGWSAATAPCLTSGCESSVLALPGQAPCLPWKNSSSLPPSTSVHQNALWCSSSSQARAQCQMFGSLHLLHF